MFSVSQRFHILPCWETSVQTHKPVEDIPHSNQSSASSQRLFGRTKWIHKVSGKVRGVSSASAQTLVITEHKVVTQLSLRGHARLLLEQTLVQACGSQPWHHEHVRRWGMVGMEAWSTYSRTFTHTRLPQPNGAESSHSNWRDLKKNSSSTCYAD